MYLSVIGFYFNSLSSDNMLCVILNTFIKMFIDGLAYGLSWRNVPCILEKNMVSCFAGLRDHKC